VTDHPAAAPCFTRCNLDALPLRSVQAHGGEGTIGFHRVAAAAELAGACNFIDLAVLPPGASIGPHRHADDEEEFYLVLEGTGTMRREEEEFPVRPGDLVRNPPGGAHALRNTGSRPLRLFVFEVAVRP
jgi:mannose-6-phosphate isomerase-like protein (cupin superfamily)